MEKMLRLKKIDYFLKLKKKLFLPSLFFLGVLLIGGCSTESTKKQMPALFDTKEEAEQAASKFDCTGAHPMGDKWMPCDSHKVHEDDKKDSAHGHNHNH